MSPGVVQKYRLLLCFVAVSASPAARAAEALPTIEVGAAPLHAPARQHPAPAPAVKPVASIPAPSPTPARTRVAAKPKPAPKPAPAPAPVEAPKETPLPALPKTPAAVNVVSGKEIEETHQFDAANALERTAPGVIINDVNGNPFSPEVDFRGFVASPVSGTPIGLAVYQNGVRINEAFGDTVNWDLIPTVAIERSAIVTGNPLFGLNAIGGAVVLDMKNGFTWQGFELDGRGGSFGRRQGSMQYGVKQGDFASYLAIEAAGDDGYRKFSGSHIGRVYGDVGWRGENAEVHFTLGLAQNRFGVSGPAPVDFINIDPSSVYTTPQTTKNTLSQYGLNGSFTPAENWRISAICITAPSIRRMSTAIRRSSPPAAARRSATATAIRRPCRICSAPACRSA